MTANRKDVYDETSATGGDKPEPPCPDEARLAQLERLLVRLTERDIQEATRRKQARKARRRRERRRKRKLGVSLYAEAADMLSVVEASRPAVEIWVPPEQAGETVNQSQGSDFEEGVGRAPLLRRSRPVTHESPQRNPPSLLRT
jgi:hypothetical protein